MTPGFVYRFAWDSVKAASNLRKHGISFDLAATVLRDPLARSRYEDEHSAGDEERWITLGLAESKRLLVVIHTMEQLGTNEARVRIISAREATAHERQHYQHN